MVMTKRFEFEPSRSMPPGIGSERQWRCPASIENGCLPLDDNLVISRWKRDDVDVTELTPPVGSRYHTIAINLKSTRVTFYQCDRLIHDGSVMPGTLQVTSPDKPVRAVFHSACEVLHLYVTQPLLAECYESAFGTAPESAIVICDPSFVRDPAIERLGLALINASNDCGAFGRVYAESVGLAIVSRVLTREFNHIGRLAPALANSLPVWQLKRAIDYIDAHLSRPIGLADIARSTGLSRMYFAAQFRIATGLRPHEFVLRRRIERAQTLLLQSESTSLDIALSTGFGSQSHFATVFKRLVGESPARWRTNARNKSCAEAMSIE